MKKILITGGSGLLGSNLALRLRKHHEVFILLNKRKIAIPFTKSNKFNISLNKVFSLFKPELVINTVAITDIELCEINPKIAKKTNVTFLDNIISLCLKYKSKLVHISTDHLSCGIKPMTTEKDDTHAINEYAKTKLLAEKLVQKKMHDALIIRTNFFGWGPKYRYSFSDRIINSVLQNKKIYLFKDAYFSPVSIYNLIKIILKLYETKASGIFNVSSNDRISKYDFGILLSEILKLDKNLIIPISIKNQSHLTIRPEDTSINNSKISKKLNFNCGTVDENIKHLFIDIKDGIREDIMNL